MGLEIERKFLVDKSKVPFGLVPTRITQGYLNLDPERTVRIRVSGPYGYITVKGLSSESGLSRFEWEKQIDFNDAHMMLRMCVGVIDKGRHHLKHEGKLWEIDVFHGDNRGLVVAEVELSSVDEFIILPEWITQEVTGDPKYYNSNLIQNPYKDW